MSRPNAGAQGSRTSDKDGPLRIVMVGNGATVHALVRGGAIASLGHSVRLVTLGPVLAHRDIEVKTRPLPTNPIEGLQAFSSFQRDLREFQPDLLHVHYAGGRLGSLALASGIKPLVVTVMGGDVQPEQHMGKATALDHRTTRRLLAEADLILAKSEALRTEIARYGDYAAKTETVRWGIEATRFKRNPAAAKTACEKLGLPGGTLLLSPRILRPLYNVHLIVEALPGILATRSDAMLLVSRHREDAEYASLLRRRAVELGVGDRVRFIDPVGYEDMPGLLSATSVVISVPFSDGLPQTLFECLASETPIVLGRLTAYEEMVQDDREVLLSDLNAAAIANAVSRMLVEPGLASRLAKAGLQRVLAEASLPEEARRVESFYRRALARHRSASPLLPRVLDAISLAFRQG